MTQVWQLYKRHPSFVLGFHGCDRSIGESVLEGRTALQTSENPYDWLGSGIYFWEGNPERAMQFATDAARGNSKLTKGWIRDPFVVGAVIDLGLCCNLMESSALAELATAHKVLVAACQTTNTVVPANRGGEDKLVRHLDKAVIEAMHQLRDDNGLPPYDSVRSAFFEGGDLYPGAGFTAKAHIQLAIRSPSCIRGYFRPIQS